MAEKIIVSKSGFDVLDNSGNISQLLDSNNINLLSGGTALSGETTQALAQSFISTTEKIKSVDLKFFKTGTPLDNVQLDIVSTLGGTSLGSAVLSSASINSGSPTNFPFSSDVNVNSGGTYNLQVTRSGTRDTSNYWGWYLQFNTNPYSGGNIIIRNNGTWGPPSSGDLASDFYFNIYPDNVTDPTHVIFSSDYNSPKTAQSGTVSGTVNAGAFGTVNVSHSLGINPLCLAYYADVAEPNKYRIVMSDPSNGAVNRVSTNLNVQLNVNTGTAQFIIINNKVSTGTATIYYEIFYEGN